MLQDRNTKRPSFLSGVGILTLSSLTVKVIGLFYRIPLLNYLGTEGMGYFNTAYELYALFCVISTAGLPVAMSVLIASFETEGRARDTGRVFRVALALFAGVGGMGTLLLWGLSAPFASLLGSPLSAACMRAISPTVFLICLSSAFRGYFQGKGQMLPTAISQVMEAAGKLFLGLAFAGLALSRGETLPVAAAYAVLGLTVGTALSVVYLLCHKTLTDRREPLPAVTPRGESCPILKPLLATAIPVTVSAGIISLTKCIDLALILRRLQAVGYTAAEATALYGCYSTLAVPVFNILPSLTTSVALSATPALSAALKKGREGIPELKKTASSVLGVTLILAFPAALGIAVFAEDILSLLMNGGSPQSQQSGYGTLEQLLGGSYGVQPNSLDLFAQMLGSNLKMKPQDVGLCLLSGVAVPFLLTALVRIVVLPGGRCLIFIHFRMPPCTFHAFREKRRNLPSVTFREITIAYFFSVCNRYPKIFRPRSSSRSLYDFSFLRKFFICTSMPVPLP